MESPNEFCYLSAATSPTRSVCSAEESLSFYSAPTSPTSEASHALFSFIIDPTTPKGSFRYDHFIRSFLGDRDFEFETSRHFNPESQVPEKRDRLDSPVGPAMAFADELFCDGKVVPLTPPFPKLKPPPGFRGSSHNSDGATNLRSPRSPFPRQSLWNDDFDPFMAAIETVREDGNLGDESEGKNGAWGEPTEYYLGFLKPPIRLKKPNESVSARWASPARRAKDETGSKSLRQEMGNPKGLAEPRGVTIARHVRRVKLGFPEASPARKGEKGRGSRGPHIRGNSKRIKIMRLLFRGKECSDDQNKKLSHENQALWKPAFLRRLSFTLNGKGHHNTDKKIVSHVAKMTLIQYRLRLSFCMGYRARYAQ